MLDDWRRKWMDPERPPHGADEDGLTGYAHYLGQPTAEGGGFVFEIDFGSASLEAFTELLSIFVACGALEVEVGCSDGSDLEPEVAKALQRCDLSEQGLNELIARLLRGLPEMESVEVAGPQELAVKPRGPSGEHKVFTGNLFMRLQRTGAEGRVPEVWRFIRGQREAMQDTGAPDLAQLRPVIKDQRFFREMERVIGKRPQLVTRPLAGDLSVVCVWDQPHGMRYARSNEPEKYAMSADQMLDRAIENYLQHHPEPELVAQGPFQVARTGDNYDASLLLDDAFWDKQESGKKEQLLVCAPARDVVLLGYSGERVALAAIRRAAAQISAGGDHLISETVLVRVAKSWRPLDDPSLDAVAQGAVAFPPRATPRPARKPWWKFWS